MNEYKKINKKLFYKEALVAELFASYPVFEELESINLFYENAVGKALEWFSGFLYAKASDEYDISDDPKKRFGSISYRYTLNFKVTHCEGQLLSVKNEVTLKRGKNDTVAKHIDAQVWRTDSQIIIKPPMLVRKFFM